MSIDLSSTDQFVNRHIGPSSSDISRMLDVLGVDSLDTLSDRTVPVSIRMHQRLDLPPPLTEKELLDLAEERASQNEAFRSFIGMGYYNTITPPAILRNVFENPSWYTQYTPYQAEIAQGRLEALLNYQTMLIDLTGLEIANASLLDEGTAAAEAMMMFNRTSRKKDRNTFFVAQNCHPQTIAVVQSRAEPLGIQVVVGDPFSYDFEDPGFGALLQYPATDGVIEDYEAFCTRAHEADMFVAVATDLLSLTLLRPPGAFGADVALGNSQRFGVPMGYGGPHAAFFAAKESFKRQMPGRIIGVSVDADGAPALRMALQTREQHIRRDRATSNICTAQVLLAVMAGMYAVYHGPAGLISMARRIHNLTKVLAHGLQKMGYTLRYDSFFDTVRVNCTPAEVADIQTAARLNQVNLRWYEDGSVGISLDETVTEEDLETLFAIFERETPVGFIVEDLAEAMEDGFDHPLSRTSSFMEHPVFNRYHSETELMRYIHKLASRDLSLTTSMIPLGSCTMKLNAAAELMPVSLTGFNGLHPFVPLEQAHGYTRMMDELKEWLAEITGFDAVSLQPNSGAAGEYTGLLTIRAYHRAHGTNIGMCVWSRNLRMAQTPPVPSWPAWRWWWSRTMSRAISIWLTLKKKHWPMPTASLPSWLLIHQPMAYSKKVFGISARSSMNMEDWFTWMALT